MNEISKEDLYAFRTLIVQNGVAEQIIEAYKETLANAEANEEEDEDSYEEGFNNAIVYMVRLFLDAKEDEGEDI